MKWGSPGMVIKCRTAQAISLQGWSSGLCAGWLFLWVASTSLRRGIYFNASSYTAASSLLYFTAALLNLFMHYNPISQKDKQLFNHAAAQLGSEQETCLRLRWEATGYAGQQGLVQILHLPMCWAQTGPREVWRMLGRTPRTGKKRWGEDTGFQPCC